ncbi:MAG: glycosyltransferase involved in cell wall biosynthesis [Chitinophagales bacterium]|jgi:glycosyltransferase involved in cell wall biosynthesis
MLNIIVPTYNRSALLEFFLSSHFYILDRKDVIITVYDNNSEDGTSQVVSRYVELYKNVRYVRRPVNIGAVENVLGALRDSGAELTMVLADSYYLSEILLGAILSETAESLLVINYCDKIKRGRGKLESDSALRYFSGIMSCLPTIVFNQESINHIDGQGAGDTEFPHTQIAFNYLALSNNCVFIAESIIPLDLPKNLVKLNWSYTNQVFKISCHDWHKLVKNLPDTYSVEAKSIAFRQFLYTTGLFSFKSLALRRAAEGFSVSDVISYKSSILACSSLMSFFFVLLMAIFPWPFLKKAYKIFR